MNTKVLELLRLARKLANIHCKDEFTMLEAVINIINTPSVRRLIEKCDWAQICSGIMRTVLVWDGELWHGECMGIQDPRLFALSVSATASLPLSLLRPPGCPSQIFSSSLFPGTSFLIPVHLFCFLLLLAALRSLLYMLSFSAVLWAALSSAGAKCGSSCLILSHMLIQKAGKAMWVTVAANKLSSLFFSYTYCFDARRVAAASYFPVEVLMEKGWQKAYGRRMPGRGLSYCV